MKCQYANIPKKEAFLKSLTELLKAFLCMGLLVYFGDKYNFLYLATEEFGNLNLLHKVNNFYTVLLNKFINVCSKN